jgi:hypothetical protein
MNNPSSGTIFSTDISHFPRRVIGRSKSGHLHIPTTPVGYSHERNEAQRLK